MSAKSFYPPSLARGGFTPPNGSDSPSEGSHGSIPFGWDPPTDRAYPPVDQGIPGRCDRGNPHFLTSRGTHQFPPGRPPPSNILGRMTARGKPPTRPSPLPDTLSGTLGPPSYLFCLCKYISVVAARSFKPATNNIFRKNANKKLIKISACSLT